MKKPVLVDCRLIKISLVSRCCILNGGLGDAMSQAKNWCFTLNNYTDADIERISGLISHANYIVFGKEVGLNGTPHLQGLICLKSKLRRSQIKALIGSNPHLEVTRSVSDSETYCKKEGDYLEFGDIGNVLKPGQRCDLEAFKDDVKAGIHSLKELRERHSKVCGKYPRFVTDYIGDQQKMYPPVLHPLYGWQQTLYLSLAREPDSRKITFIVDPSGNKGKSWFCRYYCSLHEDAQIVVPGKKADMIYALRTDIRVLFIDAPRSKQGEYIQYDFLEEVKNGLMFSPKYESRMKFMSGKVHIVVFMNEPPDMAKLSADRYNIVVV